MSRGLGRVQNRCLSAIALRERRGSKAKSPDTFEIIAFVYQLDRDGNGDFTYTDAQHVAVKRALAGLRRKGMVIGVDRQYCRPLIDRADDGRTDRGYCWMSEKRAQQFLREHPRTHFKEEMLEIGMKPE